MPQPTEITQFIFGQPLNPGRVQVVEMDFLCKAVNFCAGWGFCAKPPAGDRLMTRIASVATHMISVPRSQPVWTAHEESKAWNVILIEVRTDDGLVGYGEIHGAPMQRICEWV